MSETNENEVFETGALNEDGDEASLYVEDDLIAEDPELDPEDPAQDVNATVLQDDEVDAGGDA